jgi:hypothetical protein
MDIGEIFNILLGIFIVSPWWLKLIIIGTIFGIPMSIKEKLDERKDESKKRSEIKEIRKNVASDGKLALSKLNDAYEKQRISDESYEELLLEIIKKSPSVDAVNLILELYKKKQNHEKYSVWQEYAANMGDIDAIIEYFGFSEYDVNSSHYDEILSCLDRVETTLNEKRIKRDYLKGIIYYKLGNIDKAKYIFNAHVLSSKSDMFEYMIFKCILEEKNIYESEKKLIELETRSFEVLASDYKLIYDYYVSKRGTPEQNYDKEVKYAEKYSNSKDANIDISTVMKRDSYFYLADEIKDDVPDYISYDKIVLYEKSAELGHTEAMYILAKYYWAGNGGKNYFKTIQYFGKAANNGNKKAKEILNRYAFDGILIQSMNNQDVEYVFLDGHRLTVSGKMLNWFQMFYGIRYKSATYSEVFKNYYIDNFKTFDQLVNGVHMLYSDCLAYMLKWCVELLVYFGIDMYSPEDILEKTKDLSLLPRTPRFSRGIERIDNRAIQLNVRTAYNKATRRTWIGSGYGTNIGSTISASLKASVAAGAMNIGSSILHGIGDSVIESMDNAELKSMGEAIFNDKETIKEFISALTGAFLDIAYAVMQIADQHCNVEMKYPLKGTIFFGDENLSKLSDKVLNAKISNNISIDKNDYVYALLVESLRRNPYNSEMFKLLCELTLKRKGRDFDRARKSCLRYAGDFNIVI